MTDQSEPSPFHHDDVQKAIFQWWKGLEHHKGERARLRRCQKPEEALLQTGFFRLYEKLSHPRYLNRKHLAGVAGLLSHVRETVEGKNVGELLGKSNRTMEEPVLSESRFRRLLQYDEVQELYHPMIRIVRFLDHKLPIHEFSKLIYYWGDQQKERLAFQYYETLSLTQEE